MGEKKIFCQTWVLKKNLSANFESYLIKKSLVNEYVKLFKKIGPFSRDFKMVQHFVPTSIFRKKKKYLYFLAKLSNLEIYFGSGYLFNTR